MKSRLNAVAAVLAFAVAAPGAPDDWAEGVPGRNDGANHTYYNMGARLPWRNSEGDWRDAAGVQQGDKPFAVAAISRDSKEKPVEWDVTAVVRDWASGKVRNKGVLLRNVKGGGNFLFHSREAEDAEGRPRLVVVVDGKPRTFEAVADTHLVRSTYRPQGNSTSLRVDGAMPALVRFDLSSLTKDDRVEKATLRLVSTKQYAGGEVGVFLCDQGEEVEASEPLLGLAAKYPGDRGIDKDPDVLFATGFEAEDWKK